MNSMHMSKELVLAEALTPLGAREHEAACRFSEVGRVYTQVKVDMRGYRGLTTK